MTSIDLSEECFRIGEWNVWPSHGILRKGGRETHLGPQQMEVLSLLAANPGRTVEREKILGTVWAGTVVEEGGLTRCISEIRRALGDNARRPLYIQTVPKRGYRLISQGRESPREVGSHAGPNLAPPAGPAPERWRAVAAVAAAAMFFAVGTSLLLSWLAPGFVAAPMAEHRASDLADTGSIESRFVDTRPGVDTELAFFSSALPRPATRRAWRLYEEGAILLRHLEALPAEAVLRQALEEDPDYPAIQLALGEALALLGRDQEAASWASRALDMAAGFPRQDGLWIKARAARVLGQPSVAIEGFAALTALGVDRPELALELARSRQALGAHAAAVTGLRRLAEHPLPDPVDVALSRLYLAESLLVESPGEALEMARVARQAAASLSGEMILALALRAEAEAFFFLDQGTAAAAALAAAEGRLAGSSDERRLADFKVIRGFWAHRQGRNEQAEELANEALASFKKLGHHVGQAGALRLLARFPWYAGEPELGGRLHRQALELYRQVGDRAGEAMILNELAVAMQEVRGAPSLELRETARDLLSEALMIFRQLESSSNTAAVLHNLGHGARDAGLAQVAAESFREAVDVYDGAGRRNEAAVSLTGLGHALRDLGEPRASIDAFQRTIDIGKGSEDPRILPHGLMGLGISQMVLGELEPARQNLEESLAHWRRVTTPHLLGWTLISLSQVYTAQGDLTGALRLMREALDVSRTLGDLDLEERAGAGLADLFLRTGQRREAVAQARELPSLSIAPTSVIGATALLTRARVELAAGSGENIKVAETAIERVLRFARSRGLPDLEIGAALSLMEHQPDENAGSYLALEREARERGLEILARRIQIGREARFSSPIIADGS